MTEYAKQTCGRRMKEFGPWERAENLDYWQDRDGFPCCSFCGSLKPEELFACIEGGLCEIGPTDKSYKIYIKVFSALTGEALPVRHLKLYFQHFTEEHKNKFIQLYNSGMMKLGYPGYFYQLPYFAVRNAPEGGEST